MFRTFTIPLSWSDLFKRTARETMADDCLGLAAQLAYYVLLALVPALVFLLALMSFFPSDLIQQLLIAVRQFAPGEVSGILETQLREIAAGNNGGLLTFGIAMALWSSSAAMVAITGALNRAYDIEEGRPWWKVRLVAIALTIALSLFVIAAFALILVGPQLGASLADRIGLGATFHTVWMILRWPLAFVLVAVAVAVINYFAPDAEQDWEWITPGALLATLLWLVASLAFKLYVSQFGNYNETYGSLGGVIVLMLWFYISALAVLIGAEMNAEIEHASPHGKAVGEKVPGEKKKLGAAAARAYEEKTRAGSGQVSTRPRAVAPPPRQRQLALKWYVYGLCVDLLRRSFTNGKANQH
jgi:membrane protein